MEMEENGTKTDSRAQEDNQIESIEITPHEVNDDSENHNKESFVEEVEEDKENKIAGKNFGIFLDKLSFNKHCEILVSCSDEERNCLQAQGTACKLM